MSLPDPNLLAWREQLRLSYRAGIAPHTSNLLHQLSRIISATSNSKKAASVLAIRPFYQRLSDAIAVFENTTSWFKLASIALTEYLDALEGTLGAPFVSQSDFKTSIIPEFFLRIFSNYLKGMGSDITAVGQKDIPIEISLVVHGEVALVPRMQRVDIALGKRTTVRIGSNEISDFFVPVFAAESKTYFDKNMISGVDFSVEVLKSTYPQCTYLCIGERTDFAVEEINYAHSSIDEIYVLRKQKRGDFRRSGLGLAIDCMVLQSIFEQGVSAIEAATTQRDDLGARIPTGLLIQRKPICR